MLPISWWINYKNNFSMGDNIKKTHFCHMKLVESTFYNYAEMYIPAIEIFLETLSVDWAYRKKVKPK